MDDANKRERDAAEQTPPRITAENNPRYLPAMLLGVQGLRHLFRVKWDR